VHHVVIPLDGDHLRALQSLRRRAATSFCDEGHITLVSFEGAELDTARQSLLGTARTTAPFVVRAHGYGVFVGDDGDTSIHVPVVRDDTLNALHCGVVSALRDAGAAIAGWSEPKVWTPHVTIVSGAPDELASVVAALAAHAHPSWHLPVRLLQVVAGRGRGTDAWPPVPLSG
jgi:2'-5' RNA ligase